MMKKILFVLPSITQSNGIASFVFNYILGIKTIDISILASDLRPSQEYINICNKNNINLYLLPSMKSVSFVKYLKNLKKFFKYNHNYDAIYSNVANQSLFIFKLAKKYKIDLRIVHSHATESSSKFMRKIRNNLLEKLMLKYTTHRFACSIAAGKAMFHTKEFDVINNAIDYERFSYNLEYRTMLRNNYSLRKDDIVIGFVGRFTEQKNIFFFAQMAKLLSDKYKFIMIGTGNLKESFEKSILENKMSNRFIILDEVSDVYKYYSAMDFFALPSIFEGLPVVGVEAQANGLCCLFSKNITEELRISKNSYFISVTELDKWISIIKTVDFSRSTCYDKKYDITEQRHIFEEKLLKILGEKDSNDN